MAEFAGKTKVVFVGNLVSSDRQDMACKSSIDNTVTNHLCYAATQPYDATEQEVQKVFEVAGPVRSFRHVFDRDNNKAKGFGGWRVFNKDYVTAN